MRETFIALIHISTDAVFDGTKGDYREEDEPHPLGVFASNKLAGEQAVLAANPQALIDRVNFYGGVQLAIVAWLKFCAST